MEKMLIDLQYEPGSIQDTIIVETEEGSDTDRLLEETPPIESLETAPIVIQETPEPEGELVDFYITAASIASLKGVLVWSKILAVCLSGFTLFEGLLLIGYAQKIDVAPGSFANLLAFFRAMSSLGISVWLLWHMFQFHQHMGNALKSNNNHSFLLATTHQATFLHWMFINILVNLGFGVLMIFSAW